MKKAAALRLKSDYANQLDGLALRIRENATKEKGLDSIENPLTLMKQYDVLSMKLLRLSIAINVDNAKTQVEYTSFYDNLDTMHLVGDIYSNTVDPAMKVTKKSVMEALMERDTLSSDVRIYRMYRNAAIPHQRETQDEIKQMSILDPVKLQLKVDSMEKFLRLLDALIQENNWTSEFEFEG